MLMSRRVYYGWRVVAVCFVAAVFTWGFGVFGASVYLSAITSERAWSVSTVSGGITAFYLTNALSLTAIGSAIDRYGPRPVLGAGSLALAIGVASLGLAEAPWQLYPCFVIMGLGYATLSLTGLSATIAPWFERHQGRSVALALMGASFGAIVVVPLLVLAIERFGFAATVLVGGCLTGAVMVPWIAIVLRFRGPQELGTGPDGDLPDCHPERTAGPENGARPQWSRAAAVRSPALWTIAIAFAVGLVAQIGFLTHHVNLSEPVIGAAGAGWLVSATGVTALLGRMLLARIADQVDLRLYTGTIFATQAVALATIALFPSAAALIGASLIYGFCLGQITTLSPIIVRREFGAASFGSIYSVAATVIQLSSAFGPAAYGFLRDLSGGYAPVLAAAAAAEVIAMATLLSGRRGAGATSSAPATDPAPSTPPPLAQRRR